MLLYGKIITYDMAYTYMCTGTPFGVWIPPRGGCAMIEPSGCTHLHQG